MPEWTDELRQKVVKTYVDAKPTPETSMDIVNEIAADENATPNGVRSILSKAGVYVKKVAASAAAAGADAKPKRVNKAESQKALSDLIESLGKEADADVISRLTGKAANYLVETFTPADED